MGKFIVPRNLQNKIEIVNEGGKEIKSLHIKEKLPEGWTLDGAVHIFMSRRVRGRMMPFRLIKEERTPQGNLLEVDIKDIRNLIGRYLGEGEYLIVVYLTKAPGFGIPETVSELTVYAKTTENVYNEVVGLYGIPLRDIRSMFGFF